MQLSPLFVLPKYAPNVSVITLNPSSPGFSGSKSYNAVQHGCLFIGDLDGDFIGEAKGDATEEERL